jgi:hypothetical protein
MHEAYWEPNGDNMIDWFWALLIVTVGNAVLFALLALAAAGAHALQRRKMTP